MLVVNVLGFVGNGTGSKAFPSNGTTLSYLTSGDLGWGAHTQVYPKSKTRPSISFAVERFSKRLAQFENLGTDVIVP